MVDGLKSMTRDWSFDRVSVGIPAPVHGGRVVAEPVNLGPGWVGFDFESAFGKRTKAVNDAAMQAVGSYEGGKMLRELPPNVRLGANDNAFLGAFRLWEQPADDPREGSPRVVVGTPNRERGPVPVALGRERARTTTV